MVGEAVDLPGIEDQARPRALEDERAATQRELAGSQARDSAPFDPGEADSGAEQGRAAQPAFIHELPERGGLPVVQSLRSPELEGVQGQRNIAGSHAEVGVHFPPRAAAAAGYPVTLAHDGVGLAADGAAPEQSAHAFGHAFPGESAPPRPRRP